MAVNKVVYDGSTLIDITPTTATASDVASGKVFFDRSGVQQTGTASGGGAPSTITAGDTPVLMNASVERRAGTSYGSVGVSITIPKDGTYRLKWCAFRTTTSGTSGSRLYRNGSAVGSAITSWTGSYYQANSLDLSCSKDDVIDIYVRSRSTSYYVSAGFLTACINWDNGF